MDLGRVVVSCSEVKAELVGIEVVQALGVGKNKTLFVPKTMYVGDPKDFDSLALLGYYEGRSYRKEVVGKYLGCEFATHEGLDIERILGRSHGDCSVLLEMEYLNKFDEIIFSDKMNKDLRRSNAVVAYSLGGGRYFCVSSFEFMELYSDNWLKDRIRVTDEIIK